MSIRQRLGDLEALERDLRGLGVRARELLGTGDERGTALVGQLGQVERALAEYLPGVREALMADAAASREVVDSYIKRTYGRPPQQG